MFNVIAYGSLLNKEERSKHGFNTTTVTPIVVDGFKRSFNQEPSWRLRSERERAVLSVAEQTGSSFNALLITGLDDNRLDSLDERERGYTRISVPYLQLSPFFSGPLPQLTGPIYLYYGKPEKRNNSLLPNASYLKLCMRGALEWGQEFQNEFLTSTFIAGQTVRGFLTDRSNHSDELDLNKII
ncbi:MAG: gamma-glutamylcyclotransferase family protein [Cyanobacteria bacterium P01_D01_bin.156]